MVQITNIKNAASKKLILSYLTLSFIGSLGYALFQVTIIPFFQEQGLTLLQIGTLFSIYWVTLGVLNIPTGTLADIYGRHKIYAIGSFVQAIAFCCIVFSRKFIHFSICEILWAAGVAMQSDALESWIVEALKVNKEEGLIENVFYVSSLGGQLLFVIGGIIGVGISSIDIYYPWILSALFMLVLAVMTYTLLNREICVRADLTPQNRNLLKNLVMGCKYCFSSQQLLWLILVYSFLIIALQAPNTQWQSLFSTQFGLGLHSLSFIWIIIITGVGLGNLFGLYLKVKPEIKIVLGLLLVGIPMLLVKNIGTIAFFAPIFAIHEAGRGMFNPSFSAFSNAYIDNPLRSTVLSAQSSVITICAGFGGVLSGWWAEHHNLLYSWKMSGVLIMISMLLFILFVIVERSAVARQNIGTKMVGVAK